jgi:pyrimidine-nucleoside phosphorylase
MIKDIITKKDNGLELTKEEIEYVVSNYVNGSISDEDMTLLLNAITKNSMSIEETYDLTIAMLNSGDKIDLSSIEGIKVDKHSTGGIGDKTSFVVLPLAASLGVKIAKMSGRGLGFTGGTIDKLESIPGFKTSISTNDFIKEVNDINMAIVSQTENLVPADKKIYALRDVTGNVESIPLIASSIMSKKLASGSDKIVLDVKVGKGAFMKNIEDAKRLSRIMVDIGNKHGKETIAILTNMDYPLGNAVGNSLEVEDAIKTLEGKGDKNFTNLCIILASYMVSLAKSISIEDAIDMVKTNLYNGEGLKKFKEFIKYQGGDLSKLETNYGIEIYSRKSGYITDIDTMKLAMLVRNLGAGRINKDDSIDHTVGVELFKHINDKVEENDLLLKVYTDDIVNKLKYLNLFTISDNKIEDIKIVLDIIK